MRDKIFPIIYINFEALNQTIWAVYRKQTNKQTKSFPIIDID